MHNINYRESKYRCYGSLASTLHKIAWSYPWYHVYNDHGHIELVDERNGEVIAHLSDALGARAFWMLAMHQDYKPIINLGIRLGLIKFTTMAF